MTQQWSVLESGISHQSWAWQVINTDLLTIQFLIKTER
jgi:hypothetical protein